MGKKNSAKQNEAALIGSPFAKQYTFPVVDLRPQFELGWSRDLVFVSSKLLDPITSGLDVYTHFEIV